MADVTVSHPIGPSEFTTIYREFVPAISNLYTIEIFGAAGYDDNLVSSMTDYLKFHSPTVSFPEETLTLERDSITKTFKVQASGAYQRANELTVTWREADDWRVKKFHELWLAKFYDRKKDCFISYSRSELAVVGLAKKIKITLPFPKSPTITSRSPEPGISSNHILEAFIMPHNTGGISLGWGTSPSLITHSMTYYLLDWNWITE